MVLNMMQFVALTAGVDTLLALVAWGILRSRLGRTLPPSPEARYLAHYLLASAIFLGLTAVAMGMLPPGTTQALVVFVSDLVLWVSLVLFVMLVGVGRSHSGRNLALIVLLLFAFFGTAFQVFGLLGVQLTFGPTITYVLTNMAPILMYAVWLPSAVVFFLTAFRTQNPAVRMRSIMFAIGLLLITYSWASRLRVVSVEPSLTVVIIASIVGFVLLLGGVAYRAGGQRPVVVPAQRRPAYR
jgi:hypothetical protein